MLFCSEDCEAKSVSSFESENWCDGDSFSSLRSSLLSSVEAAWELLLLEVVSSEFIVEADWLEVLFSFEVFMVDL